MNKLICDSSPSIKVEEKVQYLNVYTSLPSNAAFGCVRDEPADASGVRGITLRLTRTSDGDVKIEKVKEF